AGRAARRQAALRPARRTRQAWPDGCRPRARRTVLPAAPARAGLGRSAVPERRTAVGTGGAGEPGRLAVHLHGAAAQPEEPGAEGGVPSRIRFTGHRVDEAERPGTG